MCNLGMVEVHFSNVYTPGTRLDTWSDPQGLVGAVCA